jgi:predicted heme/steroid binding protein/uncharacterized membrane protein
MKEFTPEELTLFNGQNGQPCYVAFQGKVYDVSESKRWRNGKHMLKHEAARDLTAAIAAAPHGDEVFAKFQAIGTLAAAPPAAAEEEIKAPWPLSVIYRKWPFVKRHAHPFAVHFPLGLVLAGFLFLLIHLIYGRSTLADFDRTSFHLIALATLCAPFAALTGMQSWWLFYGAGRTGKLLFKLFGGWVVFLLCAATTAVHWGNPYLVSESLGALSFVYIVLYAMAAAAVLAVGFVGGQLTFPE